MRKGDMTRAALLEKAEALFCRQGYDATSVADLMAELGMSKAGFYHHFSGKEVLMQAICQAHAERAAQLLRDEWDSVDEPVARISAVLAAYIPLRLSEAAWIRELAPYLQKAESRLTALIYQQALQEQFLPMLERAVEQARRRGLIHPECPDMALPILQLIDLGWMEMLRALGQEESVQLSILRRYRRAVEVLLNAPFGSITLVEFADLAALSARL